MSPRLMGWLMVIGIPVLGLMLYAGVTLADLISPVGEPYQYTYPLNKEVTGCDLHFVRPRLYYETGLYPDQLSFWGTEIVLGFIKEPDKKLITQLNYWMNESQNETCHYPSGVVEEYTASIHPKSLSALFNQSMNTKAMYFSDGENVTMLVFKASTGLEESNTKTLLGNMWIKKSK